MDSRVALPEGTVLDGSYRIVRVLGAGGFGITYLAEDLRLETTVAIKEYFPELFGRRDSSQSVMPTSENHAATFSWGRESFVREAQTLARFRHPSIVQVTRVFEANSTAYMVMALEHGDSLEAWLKRLGRAPTQEELDAIVAPLLDALETMHGQSFLHRDIAPDNIIVRADGSPVLLDFGAARRAVAEQSRALTGIVKGGYSPQEQYATDGRLQGPWTDIYALGATLYRIVTGVQPEEATTRAIDDRMVPVAKAAQGRYRSSFLAAIEACLAVAPSERPQSIAEIKPSLLGDVALLKRACSPQTAAAWRDAVFAGLRARRAVSALTVVLLIAAVGSGGYLYWSGRQLPAQPPKQELADESSEPKPKKADRPAEPKAAEPSPLPAQKIRAVYAMLEKNDTMQDPPDVFSPSFIGSIFTPEFFRLWQRDRQCFDQPNSEGRANFWFDGQDWTISDVVVRVTDSTATTQTVVAEFKNFNTPQTWLYLFRLVDNKWLVHDMQHGGTSVLSAMKEGCYVWSPDASQQQGGPPVPAITPERFFGTWIDVSQYTCRSFDRAEGEWFYLSKGVLTQGYGNACNVTMTVEGSTLLAEGNECFGEEYPISSIRREFVLLDDDLVKSNGITYMRCPVSN